MGRRTQGGDTSDGGKCKPFAGGRTAVFTDRKETGGKDSKGERCTDKKKAEKYRAKKWLRRGDPKAPVPSKGKKGGKGNMYREKKKNRN